MRSLTIVTIIVVLCLAAAPLAWPVLPRALPASPLLSAAAFGVALVTALGGMALLTGARRRRPEPDGIGSIRLPEGEAPGVDVPRADPTAAAAPVSPRSPDAPVAAAPVAAAPVAAAPATGRHATPHAASRARDGWTPASAVPSEPDEPHEPHEPDGWVPGFGASSPEPLAASSAGSFAGGDDSESTASVRTRTR